MVWLDLSGEGEPSELLGTMGVSKWPRPNSKRIACDFRFSLLDGPPFPLPDRYFLQLDEVPNVPNNTAYALIDLQVSGAFQVEGTTGLSPLGREILLTITEMLIPNPPSQPEPWIEYAFTSKMTGFDDFHFWWNWPTNEFGFPAEDIPFDITSFDERHTHGVVEEDRFPLTIDWPTNPVFSDLTWWPKSSCFDPPSLGPLPGFAEFNGIDAYVGLDHATVFDSGPHFCEADVRFHAQGFQAIMGADVSGRIWGLEDDDGRWSNQRFSSLTLPPENTWFKYRQEFEWTSGLQLKYEIFVDDVKIHDQTSGRITTFWENLGVRRRTGSVDWGHFDLKNFKYITGSVASPITRLDMPLETNALDLGPDENHGTTHNMALPST